MESLNSTWVYFELATYPPHLFLYLQRKEKISTSGSFTDKKKTKTKQTQWSECRLVMSNSLRLYNSVWSMEFSWPEHEWLAIPFSSGSPQPSLWTQVSCIADGSFTSCATREAQEYWNREPIPSPADLPDPGIEPGSPALQADSLPAELPGKPKKHTRRTRKIFKN